MLLWVFPSQDYAAVAVDELHRGEPAKLCLVRQIGGDCRRVRADVGGGAVELVADGKKILRKHAAVLVHIGLCHRARRVDDRLGACGEPAIEPLIEGDRRDHHHQDRRQRGDEGEQKNDADMKPRRRASASPRDPQAGRLVGDDCDQKQHHQAVHDSGGADHGRRRLHGGLAGQDQEGRNRRDDGEENDNQAKRARDAAALVEGHPSADRPWAGRRGWCSGFRHALSYSSAGMRCAQATGVANLSLLRPDDAVRQIRNVMRRGASRECQVRGFSCAACCG